MIGARRRWLSIFGGVGASALVFVTCLTLFFVQIYHSPNANERIERIESLGAQFTDARNVRIALDDNTATFTTRNKNAGSVNWSVTPNDFPFVLRNAAYCRMSLFVYGEDPQPLARGARFSIDLNGQPYRTLWFAGHGNSDFVHALSTQPIVLSPLYQPSGLVSGARSGCDLQKWTVGVRLDAVRWSISGVGATARFIPRRPERSARLAIVGLAVTACLFAWLIFVLCLIAGRQGAFALFLSLAVVIIALLTHDQWDFPIWPRFVDMIAFGHANPALMWAGSPLWPYVTTIAAPVLAAAYAFTGNGSQEVSTLFLKMLMATAWLSNALITAHLARKPFRRHVFLVALLSPIGLYALAAGYREVVGALFATGALMLSMRKKYLFSAIAFAAAGTISEVFLPLTLLPTALQLLQWRRGVTAIATAILSAIVAFAIVIVEWKTVPARVVAETIAFRSGNYRFGGATWQGALEGLGYRLDWMRTHGLVSDVLLFALFSLPLLVRYVALLRSRSRSQNDVLILFAGLELAFCLSYVGVDQSTWSGMIAFIIAAGAVALPRSRFPIVLSCLCAFALYATVGLGDFVNWVYLSPLDVGLWGILGTPMYSATLAANLFMAAAWLSIVRGGLRRFFGTSSLKFGLLFTFAAFAGTIRQYPEDVIFVIGATLLIALEVSTIARRSPNGTTGLGNYALAVFCGAMAAMSQEGAAAIGDLAFAALCLWSPLSLADVALTLGAVCMLSSQVGYGWLAELAIWALAFVTLFLFSRRPAIGART